MLSNAEIPMVSPTAYDAETDTPYYLSVAPSLQSEAMAAVTFLQEQKANQVAIYWPVSAILTEKYCVPYN
jgi:ABC-type branched-subunit amino acid transport system substrate-binding protein